MPRRIGYGRATTDIAATQAVNRLRAAGCSTIVVDRGAGNDPQPEWVRLRAALRSGDVLIIATLPGEGPHRQRARAELTAVTARGVAVEVLPGARPAPRKAQASASTRLTPPAPVPHLSAGKIRRTHRPGRPHGSGTPPLQA